MPVSLNGVLEWALLEYRGCFGGSYYYCLSALNNHGVRARSTLWHWRWGTCVGNMLWEGCSKEGESGKIVPTFLSCEKKVIHAKHLYDRWLLLLRQVAAIASAEHILRTTELEYCIVLFFLSMTDNFSFSLHFLFLGWGMMFPEYPLLKTSKGTWSRISRLPQCRWVSPTARPCPPAVDQLTGGESYQEKETPTQAVGDTYPGYAAGIAQEVISSSHWLQDNSRSCFYHRILPKYHSITHKMLKW